MDSVQGVLAVSPVRSQPHAAWTSGDGLLPGALVPTGRGLSAFAQEPDKRPHRATGPSLPPDIPSSVPLKGECLHQLRPWHGAGWGWDGQEISILLGN